MDDPVFTSHYYSMIDSEETDYVEKKTYSLTPLREAASRELVKRV
jgi:hypothetical protein